jgi:hypothetical protein
MMTIWMRADRVRWFVAVATLVALSWGHSQVTAAPEPGAAVPILVELFTAEGCSSCPPADVLLDKMLAAQPASGALLIGLGEHVDYWDQLGWRDRFSSSTLTQRQQVYGAHFSLESVYTPQMVVDGRLQFVGSDARSAEKAVARAGEAPHASVVIDVQPRDPKSVVVVASVDRVPALGRGDRADVIVAVTEDHLLSNVTRGENRGRTLSHAAVVRSMTTIGQAGGGASQLRAEVAIATDWKRDALHIVAFVQESRGRAILGAATARLGNVRP